MKIFAHLSALVALTQVSQAHMEMSWPPPFRSRNNPYTTNVDYNLVDPLRADGTNFPCKGYHSLMDTSQGRSVVTWTPGREYNFTIVGGATHDGGSCQASLSYDRGKTWKVITSFHGGCPLRSEWKFTLPSDAPAGDALFAWTWFNRIGNREMYMNCARVTIKSNARRSVHNHQRHHHSHPADAALVSRNTAFSSRPNMFVANVNNGCSTVEMYDVTFPNPGPNVSGVSSKPSPPRGQNCGAPVGGGSNPSAPSTTSAATAPKPATTSSKPASSAPANGNTGTAKIWEKCGGKNWTGPTRCASGLQCHRQDEWYSQCIPASNQQQPVTANRPTTTKQQAKPTTSATSGNTQLSPVWGQCGGVNWKGPKACQSGSWCHRQSEWYSQCMPNRLRV